MIVVDASLAVKWFLEEPDSQAAQQIMELNVGKIIVPDLFVIEVMAVLVRNANMRKSTHAAMHGHIEDFTTMLSGVAIQQERTAPSLVMTAAKLAIDIGHPLKDCLYLALAMEMQCDLITCDARFAEKARSVWGRVRVLGS